MPIFWFLAGVSTTIALLVVALPWLARIPRLTVLLTSRWQRFAGAAVIVAAIFGVHSWLERPEAAPPNRTASTFANAAKVFADAAIPADATNPAAVAATAAANAAAKTTAGSMDTAVASLESRLRVRGGSAGDWELLAKSYEFLGRPADAATARARKLPAVLASSDSTAASSTAATGAAMTSGATAVNGEIALAPALRAKAAAGETLFIVAKSVDSPGPPVAVIRGSVGNWPLKFTLNDSQSMLPGRNLSNAGRVTIEARISRQGQPLAAAGDLQGSSGVINPADHQPIKIIIDRPIT